MSKGIIFGVSHGNGRVDLRGHAADEFELVSALYALLDQASKDEKLADGALIGAKVSEPRLMQAMSFQRQQMEVHVGRQRFLVSVQHLAG